MTRLLPITAIIPTYNRASLCLRALQSVYSQTQLPAEVLVVDDGSEENLAEVKDLLAQNNGIYLRQENAGVAAARNTGASRSTQEWLCFLDSDDCWLPEKLEEQYRLHQDNSALRLSHTPEIWMRNGIQVKQKIHQRPAEGNSFERCLDICCVSASAVMIRRDIFWEHGGFDSGFPVCEDYDLWIRMSRIERIGLTTKPLVVKYRDGTDQLSSSVDAIDSWRVAALRKLLTDDCSLIERELVLRAIEQKLTILEKGAAKRGLTERSKEYQAIRHAVFGHGSFA